MIIIIISPKINLDKTTFMRRNSKKIKVTLLRKSSIILLRIISKFDSIK